MRTSTRSRRLLGATLAAGLLLAACGGDDGDAADEGADVAAEATDDAEATDEATDDAMAEDGGEMSGDDMSDDDMSEMSEDEMDGMSEDEMEDGDHGDHDHGDMEGMDMGSADATPADEVGGELAQGPFTLLDGAPDGFEDASGTGYLARTDDGTVATLEVSGLAPDTPYVSHVHAESCATAGGPHFKFDPDGGDTPPNEIHLGFTTDADGAATWTASNDMVAGPDAVSIVIHQADGDQAKALCADLA